MRLARLLPLLSLLSLPLVAACGDKDDEEDGGNSACEAMCEQQAAGEECEAGYGDECKAFCAYVQDDGSDCAAAYEDYWECGAQAEWTCVDASGSFNGYPQPELVDDSACQAERDALYAACSGDTGDAGDSGR